MRKSSLRRTLAFLLTLTLVFTISPIALTMPVGAEEQATSVKSAEADRTKDGPAAMGTTEHGEEPSFVGYNDIHVYTEVGQYPDLPTVVEAVYSDSTVIEMNVLWDAISPEAYAAVGTFTVEGTVENMSPKAEAEVTVVESVYFSADLIDLTLSVGTLEPVFNPDQTQYTVTLKNVDSLTVTPVALNSKATIKVNGESVKSGTASNAIVTSDGQTLITIEVTAEDKKTVKVYEIRVDNFHPYFRLDPGPGKVPVEITAPTNEWTARTPLDNRVPSDFAGGTFQMVPYPFADSAGKADVLQINYVHNGTSTFGGISIQSPLSPTVNVPAGSTIEFDVYYPKSAQGKYMRWRIRTAGFSTVDSYMRDYQYNNLNPDWVGSYNNETWLKAHHSITAPTGNSSTFILELHGETGRPAETGMLFVANIKITAPDPNGIPLPDVVNKESYSEVAPLKSVYNRDNGMFMVGAIGTGPVTGVRARHYEIFVDGNNLKAELTHPRGPSWLKSVDGDPLSGATTEPGLAEYSFPTASYQAIRDSGEPGEYKAHGHVLAWYNQAPAWMRQIIPANLPAGYTGTAEFYGLGNGVTTTVPVDKELARRVQYNHIMYVMRHFLTTDEKYGSSEERGIIPFNSWDVLNEEVHESRHSEIIPNDPNSWRTSLKHTNWLVAMSDDLIDGDITEHYIYLLFKYAHIAAPNAQMAEAYKANYDSLPEYMKLDGHDNGGSIDAYVLENPPKLTYNDYGIASRSKARTVYNMVLELNTAWLSDPLYDGRPLIEDIGIQGHDSIGRTLASDNQYAMALYASLIDRGLLSGISFSELDLKVPTDAPGGGATAPAVLNVRQSDALGYEYALLYKLFARFAPYIDHIISWGVAGSGWQGSYVLFDGQSNANAGYYGAMDPDRFILGHSYLDEYFDGEYEKLQDDYIIDLGDLGLFKPGGADLSGLTLSAGTLEPAFNAKHTQYTVTLQDATSVQVTATAADSKASIKVNGTAVASGTASGAITLPGSTTLINIAVTAEDGRVKVYTITVKNSKTQDTSDTPDTPYTPAPTSPTTPTTTPTPTPTPSPVVTPTPTETPDITEDVEQETPTSTVTAQATVDSNGRAVAAITQEQANSAIEKALEEVKNQGDDAAIGVTFRIESVEDAKEVVATLPKAAIDATVDNYLDTMTVSTAIASITFDSDALKSISNESEADVSISISIIEPETLSEEAQRLVGDRPVFDFSVTSGDKEISQFNGDVTVSIPYTPKPDEDTNAIVIYYINAEGKLEIVTECYYDPATGTVRFITNHFSLYAVGYNKVNFNDVLADAWYNNAVQFIAARGITNGTGNGNYSPEANLTRAEFLVMAMRAYGIMPDAETADNFADAGNTWYTGYLAAAKRLGISKGIGDNKFAPNNYITRQEMFTLLYNVLNIAGKLPVSKGGQPMSAFSDADQVASWARETMDFFTRAGIVKGSNGKLNPMNTATRAEMAQVLYNLLSK